MEMGTLFRSAGLSGAGKTTIGNRLYYSMKIQKQNTIILDGDILKKNAGKDLGYGREERLERAYRYSALCKLLTDQGINVIVCTIAMFDAIRDWNRSNIENYVEVFLDVDMEVLKRRNRKGLYSKGNGNIAGVDVVVEYPKNPDIIIKNDGSQPLEESVQRILDYGVIPRKRWNRDEMYWNNLIELGCGNGRDCLYFARHGLNVTGIDASQVAIDELRENVSLENCVFICDDFVSAESIYQIQYDYCYSRFTLHAINEQQETQILKKAYEMLKEGDYFFVEARSVHDGKYGLGQEVEKNAYIFDGHYRRFIDLSELVKKLEDIGFTILEQKESSQFAPHPNEHAVCIRVISQRGD